MKLPSLFPAALFAGGILLSSRLHTTARLGPRHFFATIVAIVCVLLLAGYVALRRNTIIAATAFAAGAWLLLGFAAATLERASVPENLARSLIDSGKLDVQEPLRWRGRLRSDPLPLPWGVRYEIALDEVESADGACPVSGGLRLTYYGNPSSNNVPPPARAGDRVEALVRARPVINYGDPGAFDFRGYLDRQNIQLQGALRSGDLLTIVDHPRLTIGDRLARLRGHFLNVLYGLFASRPDEGALARAMLLGDRSFVERDRIAEFQKTGVYHVLVLAGLHVGALSAFFLWAGRRLHLPLAPRIALTVLALLAYASIVEDRPPIARAVLMAMVFLSARLIYRRMDLLNVAAVAALAILMFRPSEITDASFLLSFSAVATIGAIALPILERSSEPYRRALEHLPDVTRDVSHDPRRIQFRIEMRAAQSWIAARLPRFFPARTPEWLVVRPIRATLYLWDIVFLSAVLQFGMLPGLAYYFHRVALAGPLVNIPALLLTGFAVPIGFVMLSVSLISRVAAAWIAKLLTVVFTALDATVRWFGEWHRASFRVPGPSLVWIAIFVAVAIALSVSVRMRRKAWLSWIAALGLAAAGVVIAAHPFRARYEPGRLEVIVLDVGQGDSLFVSFPHGRTMLVDGGGELGVFHSGGMRSGIDVGEDVVSPYLWSRGIKQIDVVALTHAHEDHLGGLPAVFENFRVKEFWVGRDIQSAAYRNLLAQASAHGVRIRHMKEGDSFEEDGVAGSVLWPDDLSEGRAAKNDDSLVLRLTDGSESFLLAGDVERPSERRMLAEEEILPVNFLKVAHHGSKTSTTDPFLTATHPSFAAISAGRDNSFGHPSPEVTERLEAAGVRVYRTDRDGAITASTDGTTLQVRTFGGK